MISKVLQKIRNRYTKLRLQPIRVFCLHHITAEFDAVSMCEGDWIEINEFKDSVNRLLEGGCAFISLEDAYHKITRDVLRVRKYAVLTADDGYKSLDEIIPWIIERHLPMTLFINGKYTDGKSQREVVGKHFTYLSFADLQHYVEDSCGLISVQSHGYEHLDATSMSADEFRDQIDKNVRFHAYTWGRHNAVTDAVLKENNIIPVYIDGMKNYNDASCIHRELIDR